MILAYPRLSRFAVVTGLCVLGAVPRVLAAQTASQLAAWSGLILSPTGSISPVAHDPAFAGVPGSSLSIRYGRWQYDADDAIHDNLGLTWARRFAYARTEVSVTGAYTMVECGTCSGWQMYGVSARSTLFERVATADRERAMRFGAGLSLDIGLASYKGTGKASTLSIVGGAPLDATVPFVGTSSLRFSLIPGLGYGTITADGRTDGGIIPIYGGAIGWAPNRRFSINIGAQRPVIPRSTAQVGAAFSWEYRMPNVPTAGAK